MATEYKQIKGIDYLLCAEKFNAAMLTGGYKRLRLAAGRGRLPQTIQITYDDQYPADVINKSLDELKACFNDDNEGRKAFTDYCLNNLPYFTYINDWNTPKSTVNQKEIDTLVIINRIVSNYQSRSNSTARWDNANKLIKELVKALAEYHSKLNQKSHNEEVNSDA